MSKTSLEIVTVKRTSNYGEFSSLGNSYKAGAY